MNPSRPADRGSGTVLTACIILGTVAATFIALWSVGWLNSFHRAGRIADLAAVAGAQAVAAGDEGCAAAGATARRNGGEVTVCRMRGEAPSFVLLVEVSTPLRPVFDLPGAPLSAIGVAAAGPA